MLRSSRLLVLLLLVCCSSLAAFPPMTKQTTASTDPLAVSNDGTPGVYYIRRGVGDGASKWVIRFQGGAWCWSIKTCHERMELASFHMSSANLPDTIEESQSVAGIPDILSQPHGILSRNVSENPTFYQFNHVYVWYTTSDSHVGDADAGTPLTGPYQFRGKRVVRAMVQQLLASFGLKDATDVLVTGDSAGGVACLNNADFIYELASPFMPRLKTFKAFIDAGWFVDLPLYHNDSAAVTFQQLAKALITNYNATYDSSCAKFYGSAEAWRCFHAQYAHPHLQVPAMYHEYLYDNANLGFLRAKDRDFESFRASLNATFPWTDARNSPATVFAPACHLHEMIDSATLFPLTHIGSQTFVAFLNDWWQSSWRRTVVDGAKGVRKDCGS